MNLWCPNCGGTHFYYDKQSEVVDPNDEKQVMVTDHMKCKNKSCSYEFNIVWYSYVREEWLRLFSESKFHNHRKRNDKKDGKYNGHIRSSRAS